ncbi:hypothetical protein [Streptomyces phaeofaciens]|nr:hypothetical protein [Streptomyces phaeofaciens]
MSFDADRQARIAAMRETARPVWGTTGDTDTLQQSSRTTGVTEWKPCS